MRSNSFRSVAAAAALLVGTAAFAHGEPAIVAPAVAPSFEPVSLGEEISVLRAKVKQLELAVQIAQREADLRRLAASTGKAEETYFLRSIEGVGSNLVATVQTQTGGIFEVRKGDRLLNGDTVTGIGPNSMSVNGRGGATTFRLVRAPSAPSLGGLSMAVPPLPGGMPSAQDPRLVPAVHSH